MADAKAEVTISQAAFRSCRTLAVICTGPFHDVTRLPGGLDADLVEWQAGFVDATGRFMDRGEAAAAVGLTGRLESRSYFARNAHPTLETRHDESFGRAA